jgi:cytochrome c-type biogenesis protein CcmH
MIVFWAVAGVLSAVAAGLILQSAARAAAHAGSEDPTRAVYRRQLAEIDDLAERGLIAEAERKSAHAEAARRLLSAASAAPWNADGRLRRAVLAFAVLTPALAIGLYLVTGAPGLADQPLAARVAAWRKADPAELTPPELAAVLRAMVAERPSDPEGYRYLAMMEGASGNPAGASRALRRAITLAPERAELWEGLGESLVAEAGGEMSPQARRAFEEALKRDPKAVAARFHLARARILAGEKAEGLAAWRALAAELPPNDPRRPELLAAIAEAEGRAPAPAPDQMAAIRGMVEGLAARLAEAPDDPEGWVRLVRSYAVLGDAKKRDDALAAARARYAGRPEVLDQLEAAAKTETMK